MPIITDGDLKNLVAQGLIQGIEDPTSALTKKHAIQPCSVDLRVGNIYEPGEKDELGHFKVRESVKLRQGQTVIYETEEALNLPGDIAGIVFVPSKFAFQGLMVTNTGHVDPGYKGKLRFTAINIANESFIIHKGKTMASVLLFKLEKSVEADYQQRRRGEQPTSNVSQHVSRLSKDFLNVDARANSTLKKTSYVSGIIGTLAVLLAAILPGIINSCSGSKVNEMDKRLTVIEKQLETDKELRQIQQRLDALEQKETAPAAEEGQ